MSYPIAKFLFPNYVYRAALGGGRWAAGDMSLESALKDPIIGHVARSTSADPADTIIDVTLDRGRRVGGFAVLGHNLSPSARIVLQGYSDAARTQPVYNAEGVSEDAFPRAYSRGDIPWGEPNWWTRKPLAEDIGRVTTIFVSLLSEQKIARYWRVSILDPGNPDGYVEIGKVALTGLVVPSRNYAYGAALKVTDESRMSQALSGARYYDRRAKRRSQTLAFQALDQAREFSLMFDFVAEAGTTEELIFVPDSDDVVNIQRRSFCGTIREATSLEQSTYRLMSAGFVIEESL